MALLVGDPIYLDITKLPDLFIITKEEADDYAAKFPVKAFVVTGPENFKFKTYSEYVKKVKR